MIPGVQPKLDLDKNLNITLNQLQELGIIETEFNYRLVREHDGLTKQSKDIKWIEWNQDNGYFKESYTEPKIGRSLLLSPFNQYFTWQTTPLTEIIIKEENYIKFKTKNSVYELFKL